MFNLTTMNSNKIWNQQYIEKIEITPYFFITVKNQKHKKIKITKLRIDSFLRNLFFSFCKEKKYLLEIVDRIGFNLNLKVLSHEYLRFIYLKKFNQIYSLVCFETEIIKKKINLKLQFTQESKYKDKSIIHNIKNKKKINLIYTQDYKIILRFLYLLIFSKKYIPLIIGELKQLKFFDKFINGVIYFNHKLYCTGKSLLLKRAKCYIIKKTSFLVQIFSNKKKKKIYLIILIYIFYFLINYFNRPLIELVQGIGSFSSKIIKSKKNLLTEKNYLNKKIYFVSEIIYIIFCKKIIFYKKINKFLIGDFSIFLSKMFLTVLKSNIDTKIKFVRNLSYKKLLKFNKNNRKQKINKISYLITRNITFFKIRLMLNNIFERENEKKIKNLIKFFSVIGLSKFFFKFWAKLFLINPEFKTKLISKYDKKKNKYEISIKSEKSLIGSYLPIHLQKNSKMNIRFYIYLKFVWQTFDIFLGNRRNIMSSIRPFLFPYPVLESFDNDIVVFQPKEDWLYLLELQKDKFNDLFLSSLLFFKYVLKQNIVCSKKFNKNNSKNFFFSIYLLIKICNKKNLITQRNLFEEIKILELTKYNKLNFIFSFLIFIFLKINRIF
jgi:hypothetical protein